MKSVILERLRFSNLSRRICAAVLSCICLAPTSPMFGRQTQTSDNPASQRAEEIARLVDILRDPDLKNTHPQEVVHAIQRLGQMRAVEAIDDLVQLLAFARRFPWERDQKSDAVVEIQPITPGNRYPATSALYQIGRPALPALTRVIELDGLDSTRGQNALFAVQNIFIQDLTEGAKYLRQAAEISATAESARHLRQAAAQLNELADRIANTKK